MAPIASVHGSVDLPHVEQPPCSPVTLLVPAPNSVEMPMVGRNVSSVLSWIARIQTRVRGVARRGRVRIRRARACIALKALNSCLSVAKGL